MKQKTELEKRLERAVLQLQDLNVYLQILNEKRNRLETGIFSKLTDQFGGKVVAPVTSISEEELNKRLEYAKISLEFHDLIWEIEAKQNLINQYKEHVQRTLKEETKAVSDKEIHTAIQKMRELPLKGKQKEIATQLANDFLTGNIAGLKNRYEYLQAVLNFIQDNS
jgi:23S rRNA maturation mini-RNase III